MSEFDRLNQIKQRVIVALLADRELGGQLVLKGGNLLQFAFELTTRASKDVDISIDGEFVDSAELNNKVRTCLTESFAEADLMVVDFMFVEVPAQVSEDLKSFWGGYRCEFKLVERSRYQQHENNIEQLRRLASVVDQSGSTKFKIDFSRHEFCDDKETFEIGGRSIFGYSPRMVIAEKLRAICQQMPDYGPIVHRNRPPAARARDFVDLYVISQTYGFNFDDPEFLEIITKTFVAKKVPLNWLGRIQETRSQHEPDFESVVQTVAPEYRHQLQDFGFYFQFVCKCCDQLKSLWDI
ncbi:nucleotidyl transferase AbiEii/AbiGii toxin family protein [Planctomicrobium sp. SH661]|uniref:nucleotidyl transferase AbiEii/AbiGii toxin family protein n=1 Tax=Planctomicrobium sp. SH661 TaxID=3448124 RepID=UPI003F5B5D2B